MKCFKDFQAHHINIFIDNPLFIETEDFRDTYSCILISGEGLYGL